MDEVTKIDGIAYEFKINPSDAYRIILNRSNKINYKLLYSEDKIFTIFFNIILKAKKMLLGNDFIYESLSRNDCVPIKPGSYLYYLYDESSLVYIGMTSQLLGRINDHLKNKIFTNVGYKEIDKNLLRTVEKLNIFYHRPFYNSVIMDGMDFLETVLKHCDFNID